MRRITIFAKIIFSFLLIAIIPTFFFSSLVILSYNNLIQEYLSLAKEQEVAVGESFFSQLNKVQEDIRLQVWLTLFLIVILVGFSFVIIYRNTILPLRRLNRLTKEVARGNLAVKIESKRKDEIGELMRSFAQMTENLRKNRDLLEEKKKVLEVKVRARTHQLREQAEALKEENLKKTKELRERLRELEKFHRLTVGRELKMIELKKEIKKLKEELSKRSDQKSKKEKKYE